MSIQSGSIVSWIRNPGSGRLVSDQGEPLTVFRGDCCTELLATLDAGSVPVRVSYEPDFSPGNPTARGVCFENTA